MRPFHIKTPLLPSQFLKHQYGLEVYFKMECLQPSGSFKLRGIGALCQEVYQQGVSTLVASSGGNAGVAVAYSGMKLGLPAKVFIPSTSHPLYIKALESYGAEVIVAGDVWDEAHAAALLFAQENNAAYIPPFNHPTIWQGHATMIDEVIAQGLEKPDAVIASVGGGGLACGILEGLHRHGWNDVPLIAVETEGADAFTQSVAAGKLITLPKITSRATSLGAKCVTPKLMEWKTKHTIKNVVVTDDAAQDACFQFARDQRMLVELASGASLSMVFSNQHLLGDYKRVLVIVCGGINISVFKL